MQLTNAEMTVTDMSLLLCLHQLHIPLMDAALLMLAVRHLVIGKTILRTTQEMVLHTLGPLYLTIGTLAKV